MMNNYNNLNSNNQDTWVCPECQGTETQFSLRLIPTHRTDSYPKFIPQIKESCSNCGRYKRFAPQSEILISRFNQRLEVITVRAKGERDGV